MLGGIVVLASLSATDWWLYPESAHEFQHFGDAVCGECHRGDRLDAEMQLLLRGVEIKVRAVNDLLNGHCTLPEAAAYFQAVHAKWGTHFARHLANGTGRSNEERLCYQVLAYAHQLARGPEQTARVMQLESDLRDYVRRHGSISLPQVYVD
jgi:hypothetical protein